MYCSKVSKYRLFGHCAYLGRQGTDRARSRGRISAGVVCLPQAVGGCHGDALLRHGALRTVVLAGWLFTAPAVVVQGLTGWALPARYSRWWAALSVCGFGAVVAIFYLMVFKPA